MSGDIVERLRDCGAFMTTDENGDVQVGMRLVAPEDCHEAAEEIERLRAAGDALAVAYRKLGGLDAAFDAALAAWQEARREQ